MKNNLHYYYYITPYNDFPNTIYCNWILDVISPCAIAHSGCHSGVVSRLSARNRMGESFYFCEISSRFYVVTTWRHCQFQFHCLSRDSVILALILIPKPSPMSCQLPGYVGQGPRTKDEG